MNKIAAFLISLLAIFSFGAEGQSLPVSVEDVPAPGRVFSIGDIHGGLRELNLALEAIGMTSKGLWVGGKSRVVLMGDLINRGPQSREVMDFVIELESQAARAGGRVHTLLGNHELISTMGDMSFAHANDARAFRASPSESPTESYKKAFIGESKYARWLRSRNSVVRIGSTLFVHAGLGKQALHLVIEEINEMVNAWFRFYQGVGPEPPLETEWVISSHGPLWTRAQARSVMSVRDLELLLAHFGAKRMAVGHSEIDSLQVSVGHSLYGDKLVMTDTNISSPQGIISAFEYTDEGVLAYQIDSQGSVVKTWRSAERRCRSIFK